MLKPHEACFVNIELICDPKLFVKPGRVGSGRTGRIAADAGLKHAVGITLPENCAPGVTLQPGGGTNVEGT